MIIKKKKVIEALRKEPLRTGAFFHDCCPNSCDVCAVGAVIRRSIGNKIRFYDSNDLDDYCQDIVNDAYLESRVEELLEDKNYLGALSCYFEQSSIGEITSNEREKLVKFVRFHFPISFKVKDIDDLS